MNERTVDLARIAELPTRPSLADVALVAAQLGADAIRAVSRTGDLRVARKRDHRDLVTAADHAAEDAILAVLRTARPRDAVLCEESGAHPGSSGLTWVVDPLDGTLNYVHRRDDYAVSVGVERDGEYVAGAVVRPVTGGWVAGDDGGVRSNGRTPGVTGTTETAEAMFSVGFPAEEHLRFRVLDMVGDLLPDACDFRRAGSSACDLMGVALGQLDVYLGFGVYSWDVAAGVAVVRAAGGRAEWVETASGVPLLAAGTPAVLDHFAARAAKV